MTHATTKAYYDGLLGARRVVKAFIDAHEEISRCITGTSVDARMQKLVTEAEHAVLVRLFNELSTGICVDALAQAEREVEAEL